MEAGADLIGSLEAQARRYLPGRYPVQHATAQFHLGVALTDAERTQEAIDALSSAAELLHGRLPVEEAKAMNALGVALRQAGRLEDASRAFAGAVAAFEGAELLAEQGAALFNLGLVTRELSVDGNLEDAIDCFTRAGELLHAARQPRQAAAAVRERGTALLAAGRLSAATTALDDAANLAELAADWEGRGAALNAIGLTHLAAGRVDDAIEAFRGAVASHPRTVRPESYAMAKANLALAYERAGAARPARLAARQALAASRTPPPVAGQAAGVLQRLGDPPGDLPALLDEEPSERWAGLVREEVVRWVDAGPAERRREADAWLDGQLRNEGAGTALCEVWLGALLELPPKHMEVLIQATLEALGQRGADDRERFGVQASAAMARFHVPQWIRLKEIFNRVAAEIGVEGHYG